MENSFLNSAIKQFEYYKNLGDKTFIQLNEDQVFWSPTENDNSIATLVKHLAGNMRSRWTNFLTEDGEKEWRNRDDEFSNTFLSKYEVYTYWQSGWICLFDTLKQLNDNDLERIIYIRNQGHTVTEAINRQLCHYAYHVGQLVFLAKMQINVDWQTLSIAKNNSKNYNDEKFWNDKELKHFTKDL